MPDDFDPLSDLVFGDTPASAPKRPAQWSAPPQTPRPVAGAQAGVPAFGKAPSQGGFANVPTTSPGAVRASAHPTPTPTPAPFPRAPAPRTATSAMAAVTPDARAAMLQMGRELVDNLLAMGASHGASDIHVLAGSPARYRMQGALVPINGDALSAEHTQAMAHYLVSQTSERRMFDGEAQDLEVSYAGPGGARFRVTVFKQRGTMGLVARIVRAEPPTLDQLVLPPQVKEVATLDRGLVIIAGAVGSGRSTTLAALLEEINGLKAAGIVTLEQPVEFVLRPRKASLVQREVGTDTRSVAVGVQQALRQDADIIAVGDLSRADSVDAVLHAADVGKLVIACVTASDLLKSVQRIYTLFRPEEQASVRARLADVLRTVVFQRLVPSTQPPGRMAACEILAADAKIAETIRDGGRISQLPRMLRDGEAEANGSLSLQSSLTALVRARLVDPEWVARLAGPRDGPAVDTEV